MGMQPPIDRTLSIALGSSGVTLLEMCTAYATFANGGLRPAPFFLREVRDSRGEVVERTTPGAEQAISPETAYLMVRMMQEVIQSGTGKAARGLGHYLAGKTGTTNENTDAWFIGFSPDLLAGVWIGFGTPQPLGGRHAAPRGGRPPAGLRGGPSDLDPVHGPGTDAVPRTGLPGSAGGHLRPLRPSHRKGSSPGSNRGDLPALPAGDHPRGGGPRGAARPPPAAARRPALSPPR